VSKSNPPFYLSTTDPSKYVSKIYRGTEISLGLSNSFRSKKYLLQTISRSTFQPVEPLFNKTNDEHLGFGPPINKIRPRKHEDTNAICGFNNSSVVKVQRSGLELHSLQEAGRRLELITLTLPTGPKRELSSRTLETISRHQGEICSKICKQISKEYGTQYLRVTEFNIERSLKAGRVFWHLHILVSIDGRIASQQVSEWICARWKKIIDKYKSEVGSLNYQAAVRSERVRNPTKTIIYLSKKQTKSTGTEELQNLPGYFVSERMWSCSIEVSQAVKENLSRLTNYQQEQLIKWACLPEKEQKKFIASIYYVLSPSGYGIVGLRCRLTEHGVAEMHHLKVYVESQGMLVRLARECCGLSND